MYHGPLTRTTLEGVRDAVTAIAKGGVLGDLPTLWIHGELDPLAPLAETQAAFDLIGGTDLRRIVYPGGMHEVLNETNRDEVIADVLAFLDEVLAKR